MPSASLALCLISGVVLRVFLYLISAHEWFSHRVEIVGPTSSFQRLLEGIFLWEAGLSPYSSSMYHQSPALLHALRPLAHASGLVRILVFALVDVMSALVLRSLAKMLWERKPESRDFLAKDLDKNEKETRCRAHQQVLQRNEEPKSSLDPDLVAILYVLNPFTVASSVGLNTLMLHHLFVLVAVVASRRGLGPLSGLAMSFAVFDSLFSLYLLPAVILAAPSTKHGFLIAFFFAGGVSTQIYAFRDDLPRLFTNVFLFPISVTDLVPNLGMFWYFFTEVFAHFRSLFLSVFHGHTLAYIVPLAIRLRHRPLFLFCIWTGIISIFKSYPTVADTGLFISTIPLFHFDLTGARGFFLIANVYLYVAVLAPVFWGMWIDTGTGNSNFYFALSVAFTSATAFLTIESLISVIRKDKAARKFVRKAPEKTE